MRPIIYRTITFYFWKLIFDNRRCFQIENYFENCPLNCCSVGGKLRVNRVLEGGKSERIIGKFGIMIFEDSKDMVVVF